MTILWTDAQMLQLCDNIAVTISDMLGFMPTSQNQNAITNDIKAEYNRIRTVNDQVLLGVLMPAYLAEMQKVPVGEIKSGRLIGWFSGLAYLNIIKNGPYPILDAADLIATQMASYGGINDWLGTTGNVIHQYFADVFNQFVADVNNGMYTRTIGNETLSPITSDKVFVAASTDIRTATATSSSLFALSAISPYVPLVAGLTAPGGGTLEAYAKTAIGASSYSMNVTCTSMNGASGIGATITVPANTLINTVLSTTSISQPIASLNGVSLVGTATINDAIGFRVKPFRTVVQ